MTTKHKYDNIPVIVEGLSTLKGGDGMLGAVSTLFAIIAYLLCRKFGKVWLSLVFIVATTIALTEFVLAAILMFKGPVAGVIMALVLILVASVGARLMVELDEYEPKIAFYVLTVVTAIAMVFAVNVAGADASILTVLVSVAVATIIAVTVLGRLFEPGETLVLQVMLSVAIAAIVTALPLPYPFL